MNYAGVACCALVLISCNRSSSLKTVDSVSATTHQETDSITTSAAIQKADSSYPSKLPFDSTKVSIATLPGTISAFVHRRYPGYRITAASYDPLCGGGPAIDVAIRKAGSTEFSLIFRPDGSYVQQEQDMALATAPPAVVTSVRTQFAGYTIAPQLEKLTLADTSTEYSFDLSKGPVRREVILTELGAVVCDNKE